MLVFMEGGKPENPEKNPRSKDENLCRSTFERHRGRVPFDLAKRNSKDIACKHLTDFMGILHQAVKFGLGAFDLKLIRLDN